MKNYIFVDFDNIATVKYEGNFIGYDEAELDKLAKIIDLEIASSEEDSKIVLITKLNPRDVMAKIIKEGYDFFNRVEIVKNEGVSVGEFIFNYLINNASDIENYVVLGNSDVDYVYVPSTKLVQVDKVENPESVIAYTIEMKITHESKKEKLMDLVTGLKEKVEQKIKEVDADKEAKGSGQKGTQNPNKPQTNSNNANSNKQSSKSDTTSGQNK